jgi:hypothetical protein
MNMSMQEETSACRDAAVSAASEKNFEYVQPPIETCTDRFGYLALSWSSWLKLAFSGWSNRSATPLTDVAASKARWSR